MLHRMTVFILRLNTPHGQLVYLLFVCLCILIYRGVMFWIGVYRAAFWRNKRRPNNNNIFWARGQQLLKSSPIGDISPTSATVGPSRRISVARR